jgi:hypothetical protein
MALLSFGVCVPALEAGREVQGKPRTALATPLQQISEHAALTYC